MVVQNIEVTQDGEPVGQGLLSNDYPLSVYYAYGIKNSFGIGFDQLLEIYGIQKMVHNLEMKLIWLARIHADGKVQGIWKLNDTREKRVYSMILTLNLLILMVKEDSNPGLYGTDL
jgi:hypothetical protein